MGLIKGTASRITYGVIYKTDKGNGYNNSELETLVIVEANSRKFARIKAFRHMEKKEMNMDDLWHFKEIVEISNEQKYDKSKYANIFEYINV